MRPAPRRRPWAPATRRSLRAIAALVAAAGLAALIAGCGGNGARARGASLTVLVRGLDNPRQLAIGAHGVLLVAQAGHGGTARCAKAPTTGTRICVGATGSIVRIAGGLAVPLRAGLPSVAGTDGAEASGPAGVAAAGRSVVFVVQDTHIGRTGANQFGAAGRRLGTLVSSTGAGRVRVIADLARFEATHDPDRGAGASSADDVIASDPYSVVAYRGGYVVADAAANDLLWVSPTGAVRVLAVFGVQHELAPAGVLGRVARRVAVQSVPTSVVVGPDGALYVGELTGFPFDRGYARVWRVVPGQAPTVYAKGFTNVSAIAFDHRGRLLVLELNRSGLRHTAAPGALIRVERSGGRTTLASAGLSWPTGLAVAADGTILIADHGASPASGAGAHGEILRLRLNGR